MEALIVLLVLLLVGGAIGGIVAQFRISNLRAEVDQLSASLRRLSADQVPPARYESSPREPTAESTRQTVAPETAPESPEAEELEDAGKDAGKEPGKDASFDEWADAAPVQRGPNPLVLALQKHWMIALGGVCVALAGIFLVRYSIEQGLLGPTARFIAGLITGAVLHAAAEVLRRRTGATHPAFAALAGAGSITLYAALLAGMRLYDLIEPGTAFAGMALVAVVTMAMAYIHGPVLAAFGILGAYLVPILTSTGSGEVAIALVYALIVSASALLLLRYVYRPWLWWGFLAGAFGWWLITLDNSRGDSFRPFYLAGLAYLLVAVPRFD